MIYIPSARGAVITLSNGQQITHDGYFFAGDKGGAIKSNHIDVYIGTSSSAPFFPWITNSSATPFKAYVVKDQKIIDELTALHTMKTP